MHDTTITKESLEASSGGEVLTTDELTARYSVQGFCMGLCVVKNKETGEIGSFQFTHMPRFYYNYVKD